MRFLIKEIEAQKKTIKLSVKDKKLIQLLIQDGRAPVSELARKIQISKSAVTQKIIALKQKGVLLDPVLYLNVKAEKMPFYIIQIATDFGLDNEQTTRKLLEIPEISAVLWYNSQLNLLLGCYSNDIHKTTEKIENIFNIKKLRIARISDNWFHPPHVFKEIPDIKVNYKKVEIKEEKIDYPILNVLSANPRATLLEISEKTHISPKTIKKKIDEMKKSGIIIKTSNFINFWTCERELISVSFIIKGRKNLDKAIEKLLSFPQTGNVWEFDHEWNLNVVFWVSDQLEIRKILTELNKEVKEILDTEIMILSKMVGK